MIEYAWNNEGTSATLKLDDTVVGWVRSNFPAKDPGWTYCFTQDITQPVRGNETLQEMKAFISNYFKQK